MCDNILFPSYVGAGITCKAQNNQYYYYDGWVANLSDSSLPLYSPEGNLTLNRFGTFTVNFKPFPPELPPDYRFLFITVIVTTVVGWSIPSIAGWVKGRRQLEHLEECIDQFGKLDKNAIEDKIRGYYVQGKISEDHRQFLKDRISEYYEEEKDSEGYGPPFR